MMHLMSVLIIINDVLCPQVFEVVSEALPNSPETYLNMLKYVIMYLVLPI
jgi:hypothetical protein